MHGKTKTTPNNGIDAYDNDIRAIEFQDILENNHFYKSSITARIHN